MSAASLIKGFIRGTNTEQAFQANLQGDQLTAFGRAPFTESAAAGGIYSAMSAAGTPLVVIPTTLCILELYNQLNSGVVLEILDLLCFHLLGTAAQHNVSLWAEVSPQRGAVAIPALAASVVVGSQSGRPQVTATANSRVIPAAGTTVVNAGWRPWGQPGPGAVSTALPGEAFSVPVDGKLIVPPGCSLAITCVDALATASSVQVGASWNEIPVGKINVVA